MQKGVRARRALQKLQPDADLTEYHVLVDEVEANNKKLLPIPTNKKYCFTNNRRRNGNLEKSSDLVLLQLLRCGVGKAISCCGFLHRHFAGLGKIAEPF